MAHHEPLARRDKANKTTKAKELLRAVHKTEAKESPTVGKPVIEDPSHEKKSSRSCKEASSGGCRDGPRCFVSGISPGASVADRRSHHRDVADCSRIRLLGADARHPFQHAGIDVGILTNAARKLHWLSPVAAIRFGRHQYFSALVADAPQQPFR
jgi:hypothetical protein